MPRPGLSFALPIFLSWKKPCESDEAVTQKWTLGLKGLGVVAHHEESDGVLSTKDTLRIETQLLKVWVPLFTQE